MKKISAYKTKVDLKLITSKNEQIPIPTEYISSIVSDYSFESKIMPIIYIQLQLTLNLYDRFINESLNGKIYLNVTNYDIYSNSGIDKDTVKDQFTYFIPSNVNLTNELDNTLFNDNKTTRTRYLLIALLKIDLINKNKVSFNGVFKNTTTKTILNNFLETLPNVIMDDIEEDKEYKEFVLPPQNSRSNAIKYLFENSAFYNTKYNLFYDFDVSYLLNRNGAPKKEGINTVLFNIQKLDSEAAFYEGMEKDTIAKLFTIYVNTANATVSVNMTTEKNVNQIVGADTDQVTTVNLNINKSKNSKDEKILFLRTKSSTETLIKKNLLDNTSVIVNLTKANIDSSCLTPDKAYLVTNSNYPQYDGKYLLIYKKEIIARTDNEFTNSTSIGLRRISNQ